MAFLLSDSERYELRPGTNTLGGHGEDALPHTLIDEPTPVAVITVRPGSASLLRRLSHDVVVRVDGESVGGTPRTLRHGARLDVGRSHLVYDDAAADGSDPLVHGERDTTTGVRAQAASMEIGARLVALQSGREYPVPERGLVIGRDRSCDIVVLGKSVSRRHADIARHPDGYAVTNHSSNGTTVNGERLDGSRTLRQGDAIRVGREEFRFEGGAGSLDSTTDGGTSPASLAALTRPAPTQESAAASAPPRRSVPALASLKVLGGALAGTRFRVERPVCAIGRAEDNDVRIADDSVSASHATLLLKSGSWFVVDLRSSNGTYVDGYRVAGERELPAGCTLRIGTVEMKFRPAEEARGGRGNTRRIVGG